MEFYFQAVKQKSFHQTVHMAWTVDGTKDESSYPVIRNPYIILIP